jgi:hypothetical protein
MWRCSFRRGVANDPTSPPHDQDMRIHNLSPQTQRAYVEQVSRFARHFGQLDFGRRTVQLPEEMTR